MKASFGCHTKLHKDSDGGGQMTFALSEAAGGTLTLNAVPIIDPPGLIGWLRRFVWMSYFLSKGKEDSYIVMNETLLLDFYINLRA